MIKWVGNFAIRIINNTYVWGCFFTHYLHTVEPIKIIALVVKHLTMLCDDGFI